MKRTLTMFVEAFEDAAQQVGACRRDVIGDALQVNNIGQREFEQIIKDAQAEADQVRASNLLVEASPWRQDSTASYIRVGASRHSGRKSKTC